MIQFSISCSVFHKAARHPRLEQTVPHAVSQQKGEFSYSLQRKLIFTGSFTSGNIWDMMPCVGKNRVYCSLEQTGNNNMPDVCFRLLWWLRGLSKTCQLDFVPSWRRFISKQKCAFKMLRAASMMGAETSCKILLYLFQEMVGSFLFYSRDVWISCMKVTPHFLKAGTRIGCANNKQLSSSVTVHERSIIVVSCRVEVVQLSAVWNCKSFLLTLCQR